MMRTVWAHAEELVRLEEMREAEALGRPRDDMVRLPETVPNELAGWAPDGDDVIENAKAPEALELRPFRGCGGAQSTDCATDHTDVTLPFSFEISL